MRHESLLRAAGYLFAEAGYGGVTMTQIAKRAGSSIGTLYDYFPDKAAVAEALAAKYTNEADQYWRTILRETSCETAGDLAQLFVEGILHFAADRPGYAALLSAPVKFARSESARRPLRLLFTNALSRLLPAVSVERHLQTSRILIELLKALLSVHNQVSKDERPIVTERFQALLEFHLSTGRP